MKTFYITTPIYYVNSDPHIGSAYTTLFSDMMAKFYKLNNYDVKFITGTDEHGQKIEQSSQKNNEKPQEFVDRISKKFQDLVKLMKYEPTYFDALDSNFIRTTLPCHKKFLQDVWRIMVKNDWLYEGKYEGWYCISDEAYYDENELVKDENGKYKTADLGKSVEWKEEKTYFFRLSEFQELLLKIYEKYPDIIQPYGKKTEILSFVSGLSMKEYNAGEPIKKDYLKDLSVSRNNFDWGIRIPCNLKGEELLDENGEWKKDIKQEDKHVMYVWFDALFNYLTAIGCGVNGDYEKYWVNNENKFHLIGKEILRPHSVYWFAFLIAYNFTREEVKNIKEVDENIRKILPTSVYAHGWLTNEGQKISKSIGNVVIPEEEINWLKENFDLNEDTARDYFKYYLLTLTPFGNDGDYSRKRLIEVINGELSNKIGNLTKRTLNMIFKNCNAKIPEIKDFDIISNESFESFETFIKKFEFENYINTILKIADETNKYMDEKAPWQLAKENKQEEMEKVLYSIANMIKKIAMLLQPIIPYLSTKILEELGCDNILTFDNFSINIKQGQNIKEPTIIIPRLEEK